MKLRDVLAYADELRPNAFSESMKVQWLNEIEGMVQTKVLLLAAENLTPYTWSENADTELLVKFPHDKIYWAYLIAMIDFAAGDIKRYNNDMALFNERWSEYMRWYATVYRPADGQMVEHGYYLSAYSIAVQHGFAGTEKEFASMLIAPVKLAEALQHVDDSVAAVNETMAKTVADASEAAKKTIDEEIGGAKLDVEQAIAEAEKQINDKVEVSALHLYAKVADAKREIAEVAEEARVSINASAAAASESAAGASQAAKDATNSAGQADDSATAADTSAADAEGHADSAKKSAEAANADRIAAEKAKADAETAQRKAEMVKDAAEVAQAGAENAKNTAGTCAEDALKYRDEAESFKNAAAASAGKADESARAAKAEADKAERIADPEKLIANKLDKVPGAVKGNVPLFDENGQLVDSGRGADELGGGIVYVEASYSDFCDSAGDSDYTKMRLLAEKIAPAVETNKQVVLKLQLDQYAGKVVLVPLVAWESYEAEFVPGINVTDYYFRFSAAATLPDAGLCIEASISTSDGINQAIGGCQVQKCTTEIPDEGYMELLWEGVVGEHTIAANGRVDAVWLSSIYEDFFECKAVRVCVEFPAVLESGRVATKLYASAYGPYYELEDGGNTYSKLLASAYVPSGAAAGAKCQFDIFPRYGLWHEECHRDDGEVHTMSRINPFGYKDKGYEYIESVKILTPTPSSSSSKATDLTAGTKITVYGVRW